jgi:hypothetical protein
LWHFSLHGSSLGSLTTGSHVARCSIIVVSRAKEGDSIEPLDLDSMAEIRTHPYHFIVLIMGVDRILDGLCFMNRVNLWTGNPWTWTMRPSSYSTTFSIEK